MESYLHRPSLMRVSLSSRNQKSIASVIEIVGMTPRTVFNLKMRSKLLFKGIISESLSKINKSNSPTSQSAQSQVEEEILNQPTTGMVNMINKGANMLEGSSKD